jgi:uncharacterized protein (DUF488 family)
MGLLGSSIMVRQLFTAGYEGATINSFISNLLVNNIEYVLDVRSHPLSRKPGFSKTTLAKRLNRKKIQYIHLGELGAPKSLRRKLKSTGDYQAFFKKMDKYLDGKKDAIEKAYYHVKNNLCCLMCFEQRVDQCHRKIVARKIKLRDGNGLQITNI